MLGDRRRNDNALGISSRTRLDLVDVADQWFVWILAHDLGSSSRRLHKSHTPDASLRWLHRLGLECHVELLILARSSSSRRLGVSRLGVSSNRVMKSRNAATIACLGRSTEASTA